MIEVSTRSETLAARLELKARLLAEAQAEMRHRERANDPVRWRRAALLWPLKTRET